MKLKFNKLNFRGKLFCKSNTTELKSNLLNSQKCW